MDETGIRENIDRAHGYAKKGEKIIANTSGRNEKRQNVIAAYSNHKVMHHSL